MLWSPPDLNGPEWKPDKRAEKILFDTFWTSQGWKRQPITAAVDFDYAKQAGYVFDPLQISHDELVSRLLHLRSQIDPLSVAQAFSDSITTRRLDLRSALGSYGAFLRLPDHTHKSIGYADVPGVTVCKICKHYASRESEDLNVLNFERFKWGGVRHSHPLYALFDLSQFAASYREVHPETTEPFLRILDTAANAPADCRPNELVKLIASFVPGNEAQRRILIQCLGYAGILQPASHQGFFDGYPINREAPPDGKNDWSYPVSWWRGRDGVDRTALKFYFPNC